MQRQFFCCGRLVLEEKIDLRNPLEKVAKDIKDGRILRSKPLPLNEEQALAFYREHKRLGPKANGYGMKYLEKLDPKAAAEIREAMEKRAKEWAKELPTREQKLKKQEEEKQKKEAAEKKGEEKKKSKKQKAKNNKN